MLIDFTDKVVLITGGTGGIGYTVSKEFLASGASVIVIGSDKAKTQKAAEELSSLGKAYGYAVDITDTASVERAVKAIVNEFGKIDVLVQCAGSMGGKPGLEVTEADFDKAIAVNSKALFFVMQQVVRYSMQENGGSIVNIASMAGIRGMHPPICSAFYSASKGAAVALTMQAAVEWAHLNIRVNAIAPGGVETEEMKSHPCPPDMIDPIPMKRLCRPEEAADLIQFLASDKASYITGQTIVIDGGASIVGY